MSDTYRDILQQYWGYADFRGIQRDIIESIGAGHDTLGLMPTGGGKSITFQVPALSMPGVCIVITPLIALMKDQVHHLKQLGVRAAAVYSGMQHDDILRTLENCILGGTKLLYVSPERLDSELFQTKLRHMQVSFITVDEAHCISQWGYDFRPSYLEIAKIRRLVDVPILALTATATPRVVDDIQKRLEFATKNVFRMSFERKNLAYSVRYSSNKHYDLIRCLEAGNGSSIVYVRSRRHAREIADHLCEAGLSATFYHAGLDPTEKDKRQRDWQHDRTRTMVATNAFGMGIDKPDVRVVVHYDCPDSLEAYFQEAGRAGRDGKPAQAILLYNSSDAGKLQKRIADTYPEKSYIKQVYEHLAYYYQIAVGDGYGVVHEFNMGDFCTRFHHYPIRVRSALQILQWAGYIDYDEEADHQARVRFLIGREDLYRLEQLSPDEDRVIVALLRNYGGLFADYAYIDESLVAHQAGLTQPQTYDILTSLSKRQLISFIPHKQVPYIRYRQRREDAEHLQLPRSVYEDRLSQYRERIQAMLHYAQSEDRCRERLLLEYFGERTSTDCQQCDVCLVRQNPTGAAQKEKAKQAILDLLADHRQHYITELLQLPIGANELDSMLTYLVQEEFVVQQDGLLSLHAASVHL